MTDPLGPAAFYAAIHPRLVAWAEAEYGDDLPADALYAAFEPWYGQYLERKKTLDTIEWDEE